MNLEPTRSEILIAQLRVQGLPILTVMLGSMTTALPIIAQSPLMPPFGLLILLSWRLLRPGMWQPWIGLPLGAFDDIMSGQPMGSAVFLWTVALLGIEVADNRLLWRSYWHDWLIACLAISFCLIGGLVFAAWAGSHTPLVLVLAQIGFSVLPFPIIVRALAQLDHWRLQA